MADPISRKGGLGAIAARRDFRNWPFSSVSAAHRFGSDRSSNLQSGTVLREASVELGIRGNHVLEQALLTQFHELFRTGYLAWGVDLSNPDPRFFHLTEQGLKTLAQLSADPGNPRGYLSRLDAIAAVNPIARSYLEEGLHCYVADHYKASAVMIGAAAESVVLELRDAVVARLQALDQDIPRELLDWRIGRILHGLKSIFDRKLGPSQSLKSEYEAYWSASLNK
jgi:hypothetical protein